MKKYRRGRKVMRGGADTVTYNKLNEQLIQDGALDQFLQTMRKQSFEQFKRVGDGAESVDIRPIYESFFKDTGTKAEISLLTLLNQV
jgi:hypothetical protein